MPVRSFPRPFTYRTFPLPFTNRKFPLDFDRLAREFARYVVLLEIDFESGTRYYSYHGVRATTQFYKDRIIELGAISRETPPLGGAYSISDLTVSVANTDMEFSELAGAGPIYDRAVRVRFGDPQRGLSRMTVIFTGQITGDWDISEHVFKFNARDVRYDRFQESVAGSMKRLVTSVFPNLPGGTPAHVVPAVYGDVRVDPDIDLGPSYGGSYDGGGPLPAYLIDPDLNRYVVADSAVKGVPQVFVYGVLADPADYTVTEAVYGGQTMTFLDFAVSPLDPQRTSELEVTVSVQGKVDGSSSGDLIDNPIEQIGDCLATYFETPAGDLETTLYDAVRARMDLDNYKGAWAIVKHEQLRSDVLAKWSESFQCPIMPTKNNKLGFYLNTTDALPTPLVRFRQNDLRGFKNMSNPPSNIATVFTQDYMYHYTKDYFARQPDFVISGEEAWLGRAKRADQPLNLWYVRDEDTADLVAEAAADLRREAVKYVSFELSPDHFRVVDLQSVIGITHFEGIGVGGYQNEPFRITSLTLSADPRSMKVGVMALNA